VARASLRRIEANDGRLGETRGEQLGAVPGPQPRSATPSRRCQRNAGTDRAPRASARDETYIEGRIPVARAHPLSVIETGSESRPAPSARRAVPARAIAHSLLKLTNVGSIPAKNSHADDLGEPVFRPAMRLGCRKRGDGFGHWQRFPGRQQNTINFANKTITPDR